MFENKKLHKTSLLSKFLVCLYVALTLLPLFWMLMMSFKTQQQIMMEPIKLPDSFKFTNYRGALKSAPFLMLYKNSFKIMLVALPLVMLFSLMAAFAISRVTATHPRIRNAFHSYFSLGFIVPFACMLFPVYKLVLDIGVWDSLWAVILPQIGWAAPMSVMLLVTAFNKVPSSLEEAAVLDGCTVPQMFTRVMLPMVRPTAVTIFILNFLAIWNDYMYARLVLNANNLWTVSLAAVFFKGRYSTDYGLMSAGIVLVLIPQIIVFIVLQRQIMAGVTAGAVKE